MISLPNGPADLGGMKRGDVITRFDGVEIASMETLTQTGRSNKTGRVRKSRSNT